jgi:hypothetical protein
MANDQTSHVVDTPGQCTKACLQQRSVLDVLQLEHPATEKEAIVGAAGLRDRDSRPVNMA